MRYKRQEVLSQIKVRGQKKIRNSKIAVVGVGALGTVTTELLARSGIGELLLIDKDEVSLLNLQRQLFEEKDVGKPKVLAMKKRINKVNKDVTIKTKKTYLSEKNVSILNGYELILDCTDNMKARHTINKYCEKTSKKWVHGAASSVIGNVLVVDNPKKFSQIFRTGETFDNCNEIGVVNTITTMVASIQVTQALKIILGKKYSDKLIRINIWEDEYRLFNIK